MIIMRITQNSVVQLIFYCFEESSHRFDGASISIIHENSFFCLIQYDVHLFSS